MHASMLPAGAARQGIACEGGAEGVRLFSAALKQKHRCKEQHEYEIVDAVYSEDNPRDFENEPAR